MTAAQKNHLGGLGISTPPRNSEKITSAGRSTCSWFCSSCCIIFCLLTRYGLFSAHRGLGLACSSSLSLPHRCRSALTGGFTTFLEACACCRLASPSPLHYAVKRLNLFFTAFEGSQLYQYGRNCTDHTPYEVPVSTALLLQVITRGSVK